MGYAPAGRSGTLWGMMSYRPCLAAVLIVASVVVAPFAARAQATKPTANLNMAQLSKLAEKGDAAAQCEIGRRHLFGRGMKQSDREAAAWFGKSAAGGSGDALFELFLMARDGVAMAKDQEKAEKLLTQAIEKNSVRAKIESAERATVKKGDTTAVDAAVAELTQLARAGEPAAQLALGRALARGTGKAEGGDVLQWLLKASNAEDDRIALAAARVFKDGEGSLRADPDRAATLLRKLVEKEVRPAHADLAKLAPQSYQGVCKEQSLDRVSRDDRMIGAAVRIDGRLSSEEKGNWVIANDRKVSSRVILTTAIPPQATAGRYVRAWGMLDEPGLVRALLVEVPEPKYQLKFEMTEPRIMKGSEKEKYVVNGEVRNTGRQDIHSIKLTVRVFQPESGKEDDQVLTLTDLPIGERRPFTAAFKTENVKAADNATAVVQAEVKSGDLEW